MLNLLKASSRIAGALFAAGLVAAAQGQGGIAQPGTVNYTEGLVSVGGQAVGSSHNVTVQPGQILQTQDGKAEMLLTPGVFLRLNNHSQARMVSASITDTRVDLLQGEAMLEADQVEKENNINIVDAGVNVKIDKHGIYQFNADQPDVAVYDGEVTVRNGDHTANVKKGHQLALVADNSKLKTQKFNTETADSLYSWSKLRSEYMAEANMSSAQTILVSNPGWFYGTGWYWNPYFSSWAFVPGAGYFDSPFGFGFYSPAYWGVYGRGLIGRGYWGGARYYGAVRPGRVAPTPVAPAFRGSAAPRFSAPARVGGGFGGGRVGGGAHFGGRR